MFSIPQSIVLDSNGYDNPINNDDFHKSWYQVKGPACRTFNTSALSFQTALKGGFCYDDAHFPGEETETL